MGEAKRRKQLDPNYGRVPLAAKKQGLIISPPIIINGQTIDCESKLDSQELRFSLLFWDRLVWPNSNAMAFLGCSDSSFLEAEGVLTRQYYRFSDGDFAEIQASTPVRALLDMESKEPGSWSIAQGPRSLTVDAGLFDAGSGLSVELHKAIPVPAHDVPLAEILEFKARRSSELFLLRHELDSFICRIEKAENQEDELHKCIDEIDKACKDLLRVSSEWQFPVYLSSIKASLNFNLFKTGAAAVRAWKFGSQYGLTAAASLSLAAGVASCVNIKSDEMGLRRIKRPLGPYSYAYHVNKELQF